MTPLVFVGGAAAPTIDASVRQGGGRITRDPTAASAVVWLSKEIEELRAVLHNRIRWVQLPDAGVERWLDAGVIDEARVYTSARGCYGRTVAEHGLAMMLALARDIPQHARARSWQPPRSAPTLLVGGACVLVVGAGAIGTELIAMLAALGAHTIAVTRSGRAVDGADVSMGADAFRSALSEADFVVVAAPSTPETKAIFGAAEFEQMKSAAYIVNIARGELIDTDALVAALSAGAIGGACLDVTDPEPLPASSPLWTMPNVLITPHAANPAAHKHAALCERIRINTSRFAAGKDLLGRVDLQRRY